MMGKVLRGNISRIRFDRKVIMAGLGGNGRIGVVIKSLSAGFFLISRKDIFPSSIIITKLNRISSLCPPFAAPCKISVIFTLSCWVSWEL